MAAIIQDAISCKQINVGKKETEAGRTGRNAMFETNSNVVLGGWFNAAKSLLAFGTTGKITGKASAHNAEITLPNWSVAAGGVYCALEVNYVFQANTLLSANLAHPQCPISIQIGGTSARIDDWEDNLNSGFMHIGGISEGDGNIISMGTGGGAVASAGTLRFVADGVTYYIMLGDKPAIN